METLETCRRKREDALRLAAQAGGDWSRRSTLINQAVYWNERAQRLQLEPEAEDEAP